MSAANCFLLDCVIRLSEIFLKNPFVISVLFVKLFKNTEGIEVHDNPNTDFDSNFWLTTILFKQELDTEALCLKLDKVGIEARPLWKPMHLQPIYKDAHAYTNGISEKLCKTCICLPSGPWVTDEDVRFIVDTVLR